MQREITAHEKSLGSQNVCTVAVLKRPHSPSLPAGAPPPPLISTPISTADAVAAVERLVRRHPVLKRVHGFSSSQRHQFLMDGTPLFDAANHVTLVGFDNPEEDQWPLTLDLSSQWHTRLQAELENVELVAGSSLPPWRLVVFQGQTVVVSMFIYNHVICDGCGGLAANADFLAYLENNVDGKAAALDEEGPLPITQDLDSAMQLGWAVRALGSVLAFLARSETLTNFLEPAWLFLPHAFRGGSLVEKAPTPVVPDPAMISVNVHRRGTVGGTKRLLAACKRHGCTVGGFVCASLAFIGAAIEPAAQGRPTTAPFAKKDAVALGISYDINWRGRLDPPMHPSSIGCAISFGILEHSMSRGSQEFWEMAVLASKQMKSSLSGGSKSSKSALYYDMINKGLKDGGVLEQRQELCPVATGADVNYSNVGRWNHGTDFGPALGEVKDVWIAESNPLGKKSENMVLFSSCVGNQMCFSASFPPAIFSRKYGEFIMDHVSDFCEGNVFDLDCDADLQHGNTTTAATATIAAGERAGEPIAGFTFGDYYKQNAEVIRLMLPDAIIVHHGGARVPAPGRKKLVSHV